MVPEKGSYNFQVLLHMRKLPHTHILLSYVYISEMYSLFSILTVELRRQRRRGVAVATRVAPQVLTAEMAMEPGEGTVRGTTGDGGANRDVTRAQPQARQCWCPWQQ